MITFTFWRCCLILAHVLHSRNGHQWMLKNSPLFIDPTSLVMSICFELMHTLKMVTILWRFIFDGRLSVLLVKLENVHEKLAHLNVARPLNKTRVLFFSIAVVIHFMGHILKPINHIIDLPNFSILTMVFYFIVDVCSFIAYYEYVLLIICAQCILYEINDNICKSNTSLKDLRDMYLNVVNSVEDMNMSVYGIPGLINFVFGNMSHIVFDVFYFVLFDRVFYLHMTLKYMILAHDLTRALDIIMLYWVCYTTEREIKRTTLLLNQRIVAETNPRVHRQNNCNPSNSRCQ